MFQVRTVASDLGTQPNLYRSEFPHVDPRVADQIAILLSKLSCCKVQQPFKSLCWATPASFNMPSPTAASPVHSQVTQSHARISVPCCTSLSTFTSLSVVFFFDTWSHETSASVTKTYPSFSTCLARVCFTLDGFAAKLPASAPA